jgi:hypothetical protein
MDRGEISLQAVLDKNNGGQKRINHFWKMIVVVVVLEDTSCRMQTWEGEEDKGCSSFM